MSVLYRHPRIWTGDPTAPWASGLLTDGETIVAAGAAKELAAHAVADEIVDLPGAIVIPGLHDSHIHTASLARDLAGLDLRAALSLTEVLSLVHGRAAALPPEAWLFGSGWNANSWVDSEPPDRRALDSVTGDRRTALYSLDGHTMWANSAALRAAGIARDTPDPAGGRIERDETGEPTGILREQAAQPLIDLQCGEAGGALEPLLLRCQQVLLSVGLTSITDIDGDDARAAYRSMHDGGRLALRVTKSIPLTSLDEAIAQGRATGQGDDWMRVGPLKLFGDGALGSHTSHMSRDFAGDAGNRGIPRLDTEEIAGLTRRAVLAGIAVATHAIGDQANASVLDAYEKVLAEIPTGLRLRVEHAQHVQPCDVSRFARLGVVPSMQPAHCPSDIDLVTRLLGGHDLVSYGWRSMLDSGATLAFGSDAPFGPDSPVKEPSPMFALYAAVTRTRLDGSPDGGWQPEQRLTMTEALRAHTAGSAYANGEEQRKGTLSAGRLADFVALDTDILDRQVIEHETGRIHHARALMTVVGGQVRWRAD